MQKKLTSRRLFTMLMTLSLCFTMLAAAAPQAFAQTDRFIIFSPYASVDWDAFGQYKAAFHVHTQHSDGSAPMADTIADHYNKGFDILAVTDHNVLTDRWDEAPRTPVRYEDRVSYLTAAQKQAIYAGTFEGPFPYPFTEARRQQSNGMISLPATNEQSVTEHINTFWAPFNNESGDSMERILTNASELGGLAIINHPGRYTQGQVGGLIGRAASNNPIRVARYARLFSEFDVALGMEIFNRLDNETRSDRILWDNLLMRLMPEGRSVFGFSNDDSHSLNQTGYNFNMLLMPELTADAARTALEAGAFYAVARVARNEGVNTRLPNGRAIPTGGNEDTLFLLDQTTPSIADIAVANDIITITGRDYDRIEWIAGGRVIATGVSLDLNAHVRDIRHNYVRAQLISETGIAVTQPFGIWEAGARLPQRLAQAPLPYRPEPTFYAVVVEPQPQTGDSRILPAVLTALVLVSGIGVAAVLKQKKSAA